LIHLRHRSSWSMGVETSIIVPCLPVLVRLSPDRGSTRAKVYRDGVVSLEMWIIP
jgi:hypothetical protein